MMDPNTGRWTTEDPTGFDAGDPDLYRFVGNDPTNTVDPSGLEERVPGEEIRIEDKEDNLKPKKIKFGTGEAEISATERTYRLKDGVKVRGIHVAVRAL